jgi:hypothetical protein
MLPRAMSTEPEAERDSVPSATPSEAPEPARPSKDRPKKKKARRPTVGNPPDERKMNAPDVQTLGMLGVLAFVSIVLWALAHAACNYHPPRETRRPRVVKTEEFTKEAKSAAVEAIQRAALLDYKGALEIAAGPLAEELKKEQASCEADASGCASKKLAASKAQSSGIVLDRDPNTARVRVVTRGIPGAPKVVLVRAERDGANWKVTSRVPEAQGATLPPAVLAQPPDPHSFMFEAAPAASGEAAAAAKSARPRLTAVPTPAPAPAPAVSK